MFFMEKVLQIENWVNQDVFVCQHVSVKLKNHSCWIGTSYMPFQGSVFMLRCWLSIVALWSLGGGNLDSPSSGYRFSAFWLRSKCSICSYQLNIWYGLHCRSRILNWFLTDWASGWACSPGPAGRHGIALHPWVASSQMPNLTLPH